jgi:anti-sigma factor RsiW
MKPVDNDDLDSLISGYLDNELTPEQSAELEARLAASPEYRQELETMRRLVYATSGLRYEDPPEEVWEPFLNNVYNRTERRVGWVLLVVGTVAVLGFGLYHYLFDPWASGLVKLLVATPFVGLALLLLSVLRQRLALVKLDRYSRDIHR